MFKIGGSYVFDDFSWSQKVKVLNQMIQALIHESIVQLNKTGRVTTGVNQITYSIEDIEHVLDECKKVLNEKSIITIDKETDGSSSDFHVTTGFNDIQTEHEQQIKKEVKE